MKKYNITNKIPSLTVIERKRDAKPWNLRVYASYLFYKWVYSTNFGKNQIFVDIYNLWIYKQLLYINKKINTISTYLQLAAAYTLELKYSLNKTIIYKIII